jgi:protein-tyrosine phosphatase
MGYVDLHSHVLYGLDHGAPDSRTAVAMLDGLAALGISEQCVTPHQKAGQFLPPWDQVVKTLGALEQLRAPHHPTLRLAAENMWDDVFFQRVTDGTIPGYADTPAFLVEIPPALMPSVKIEALFKLSTRQPRCSRIPSVITHSDNDALAHERFASARSSDPGAVGNTPARS